MEMTIAADEVAAAFQRDWPHQYEITCLRLLVDAQRRHIAELESASGPELDPTAEG